MTRRGIKAIANSMDTESLSLALELEEEKEETAIKCKDAAGRVYAWSKAKKERVSTYVLTYSLLDYCFAIYFCLIGMKKKDVSGGLKMFSKVHASDRIRLPLLVRVYSWLTFSMEIVREIIATCRNA